MPDMTIGDKVLHKVYGLGEVLEVETIIAKIRWEDPTLSQWKSEDPVEVFWTDMCDLKVI